jgi:signal transduction histidine kinase
MDSGAIQILLVEDNPADAALLKHTLLDTAGNQFDVTHAENMAAAIQLLSQRPFDAILLDLSLPDCRGLETVENANAAAPGVPIVVLTGLDDEATAIEAVRKGAQDFLVKGQFDSRLLARSVHYAKERKSAEQQLKSLNESLEHRVAERTAVATRRAAQLRALAAELTMTEQRERRRLAQLLHDGLQQLLHAARLNLTSVRHRVGEDDLGDMLGRVDALLNEAIAESRSLTIELSPPILSDGGLKPALEWLVRHMDQTCGLSVVLEADPDAETESEDVRMLVFSAIRELLFNVVKHAGVGRARIDVTRRCRSQIRIVVTDEGVGFDPERMQLDESNATFGLFSVRERLEMVGGGLEVDSTPGRGTKVAMYAPVRRGAVQDAANCQSESVPCRISRRNDNSESEGRPGRPR